MNRKQRRAQGSAGTPPRKTGTAGGASGSALGGIVHAAAVKSAEALLDQEKWAEAAEIYKVILKENPANAAALYNYGLLAGGVHGGKAMPEDLARAATCFEKYLRLKPDDADALAALGMVRMDQGRAAESAALMDRAWRGNPSAMTLERMGGYYRNAGETGRVQECLARALENSPGMLSTYHGLCTLKPFAADSPEFSRLLAFAKDESSLTAKNKIYLHYSLGRSLLAQGDADKAFHHYAEGNRIKRGTYPGYDIAKSEQHADNLIRLFSRELVDRLKGQGSVKSASPVFIIGMPRSGSTLVDQILSSHPAVGSVGEAPYFPKSIPSFESAAPAALLPEESSMTKKLVAALTPALLDTVAKKYLALLKETTPGVDRVVDKNLFNYLWVPLIRLALPNAKIIHCTRDPHDIGLSIWQLLFNADMPWAYDQTELGRYYKAYEKVMAHWNKLFPGEIYEVNYETMVGNQEEETRKLLAFCDLPWDDRVLRFHETKRHVQTASHSQVRKPMYRDSLAKWKKYEKHLQPLIKALAE